MVVFLIKIYYTLIKSLCIIFNAEFFVDMVKEKTSIVYSSFFPFSVNVSDSIINKLIDDYEVISRYHAFNLLDKKDFSSYLSEVEFFLSEVENDVYMIGFGIFANIFVYLAEKYSDKVKKIILFEPDFTYISLAEIYESDKRILFKRKALIQYLLDYPGSKKAYHHYNNKISMRFVKEFYESINFFTNKIKIFMTINSFDVDVYIFWKTMEKKTWPLAQVLKEDYNFNVFSLKGNILDTLIDNYNFIIENVKKN